MKLFLSASLLASAAAFAPSTVAPTTFALNAGIQETIAGLQGPEEFWGAEGV
eukprot:CAMPEP_0198249228 /NCGR_PEP_ID=MMETSP1447-20131203/805_1 /TAXON_ID=420782 /ORGANISM="Chaetoceros dichaeta, Strain CCMP1751" /LENGTH=51 /DNA_ID=CAMNT_0043933801 /DNA_START=67 /DNA_END=218 /DNA_ORIENTATION=+